MANPPDAQGSPPRQAGGMSGSFRIARIFGFDIFIHWSWLFIFWLVTWSLAAEYFPDPNVYPEWSARQRWAVAAVTSLLFFASILAHEISHSLLARRRGIAVQSITLFVFGGVSSLGSEARTARDEFTIAIVGPLTSFVVAAIAFGVRVIGDAGDSDSIKAIAGYLALVNLTVGVFNLLPGFPLDGGRVLRAIVWGVKRNMMEATRVAANVGRGIAALIIGIGILSLLAGALGGLWFILIGWFLWNAAESSYHQLVIQRTFQGLVIGPVIERDVPRVAPDVTLRQLAHDYILKQNRRAFFVSPVEEGDIQGLITLTDLHKVPDEDWDKVSVYRAMTPRDRLVTATPRTDAMAALQMMAEHNINQILIVDGREPVGLLTRGALIGAIQLRNEISAMEDVAVGSRP